MTPEYTETLISLIRAQSARASCSNPDALERLYEEVDSLEQRLLELSEPSPCLCSENPSCTTNAPAAKQL